jgi:hypothetical protein
MYIAIRYPAYYYYGWNTSYDLPDQLVRSIQSSIIEAMKEMGIVLPPFSVSIGRGGVSIG